VLAFALALPSEAFALEGGQEDRSTTHAVAIAAGSPAAPDVRCSGTLISKNVVLTVRHCIAPVAAAPRSCDTELGAVNESIKDFWITSSPWTTGARWHRVREAKVPEPTKICGNDVALLVLDEPLEQDEATPARPITRPDEFLRLAKSERAIGMSSFGATTVASNDGGKRRSRWDVPLRCVPGDPSFACGVELDYIDPREFTAGHGPCPGDSGAGAVVPSDRAAIFGVLSRGNLETSCAEGIFVRTDVWSWLIGRTVLDAAPLIENQTPDWAKELFPTEPKAGQYCHGSGSCGTSGECVSLDARRSWTCVDRCEASTCGANNHCENGLCIPGAPAASDSGGCHAGAHDEGGATLGVIGSAIAIALSRRRRRPRPRPGCSG